MPINVWNYIQKLRETGIIKSKQTLFTDFLILYVDKCKVTRILLEVNPELLNKSKKVGLPERFNYIIDNLPQDLLLPNLNVEIPKRGNKTEFRTYDLSKGKNLIQYDFKTKQILCFEGI
jgi:hypothetical protein